jgi:hypothetical protein
VIAVGDASKRIWLRACARGNQDHRDSHDADAVHASHSCRNTAPPVRVRRRKKSVLDRSFLKREQTIDLCGVVSERGPRLLSAGDGVEERAVPGAHALGPNVCVVTPS